MKQSLGLLEVSGLALAISCADVMAKAASITLVGLEKTNGSGWMVIKIIGDVASVQAAISTGVSFADQRDGLVAHKVISRPGMAFCHIASPRSLSLSQRPPRHRSYHMKSSLRTMQRPKRHKMQS